MLTLHENSGSFFVCLSGDVAEAAWGNSRPADATVADSEPVANVEANRHRGLVTLNAIKQLFSVRLGCRDSVENPPQQRSRVRGRSYDASRSAARRSGDGVG
jgi:hypothetical protein